MTENVQIFMKLLQHIKIPDISLIISEYSISPKLYVCVECECGRYNDYYDQTCIVCKVSVCDKCKYADPRICTICIMDEDDQYIRQCGKCLSKNTFCEKCKEIHCELHSTENICQLYIKLQQLNKIRPKQSCKIIYINKSTCEWTNDCKKIKVKYKGCPNIQCPKHHNEKNCIMTRKLHREIEKIEDKHKDKQSSRLKDKQSSGLNYFYEK